MTEVIKMDYHHRLLVCIGDRCTKNGEEQALYDELKENLKQLAWTKVIEG